MLYCGDCPGVVLCRDNKGRYRCPSCEPRTLGGRSHRAGPPMRNIPIRVPAERERVSDASPKPKPLSIDYGELELRVLAACEKHHRDLGQCAQCLTPLDKEGTCPRC